MVHAYPAGDGYIALDVDSGAVHVLDEAAYQAVLLWENKDTEQIEQELAANFGRDAAYTAVDEIRMLVEEGLLFSHIPVTPQDIKPPDGIVKALCLHIAHDCDLRCRYCFAGTGCFHGSRVMMSEQVGKKALNFLVKNSGNRRNLEVDFFGGEPLMNFEVVKKLVAYGRELEKQFDKEIHFTLTTNCTGLDEDSIDFINKEMDNCVLSIDGRKEVHDYMRPGTHGEGSFEVALANSKKLVDLRSPDKSYYVRGTFTRHNLDFAKDVLAIADMGFEQISIEPVVLPENSPYAILPEHLPQILAEYDNLLELYLKRRADGQWFSFFHFVVDLQGGPCLRKRLTGCGAGYEYLAVAPNGDLFPCHRFVGRDEYRLGNLDEGQLNKGIRNSFAGNHALDKPDCMACWAKFYCGGGCAANAEAFNGQINIPYETECIMERKRLECAIAVHAAEAGAVMIIKDAE